jgi:hypothetical protein
MHDYDILDLLVGVVAKAGRCKPKDLREFGRCPSLCKLRDTLLYLARQRTGLSFPEIGRYFKRHHTTIMGAVNNEKRRLERKLPIAPCGMPLADWHAQILGQLDVEIANAQEAAKVHLEEREEAVEAAEAPTSTPTTEPDPNA